MTKGYVVWEGESPAGGQIVAVMTLKTSNVKTGAMAQLWILPALTEPHRAVKDGTDSSVCGMCPQRHYLDGSCYVLPFQAPLQVWKSWKKGLYKPYEGQPIGQLRLGAYGDPAMLPFDVVSNLIDNAIGYTGYTSQWSAKWFDKRYVGVLQLSTNHITSKTCKKKHPAGKQFITIPTTTVEPVNAITCLAETRLGMTCSACMLCDGKSKDVQITVHGQKSKKFDHKWQR